MLQDAKTVLVVPEVAERVDAVGLSPGLAGPSSSPHEPTIRIAAMAINGINHFTFFICEKSPLSNLQCLNNNTGKALKFELPFQQLHDKISQIGVRSAIKIYAN